MSTNPAPSAPAPTPAAKHRKWPWILVGVIALLVIIGIVNAPTTTSSTPAPPAPASAPAPVGPPATSFGDGTYSVGTDIAPGTYHTTGPTANSPMGCYWARSSDNSGNTSSIIANNLGHGPATVTISPADASFQTDGCNRWTLVK